MIGIVHGIREASAGMFDGEQRSGETCPFCKSKDKSFSMKREKWYVYYMCHRDSCGKRGRCPMTSGHVVEDEPVKKVFPMPSLEVVPYDILQHLRDSYSLDGIHINRLSPAWSAKDKRVWFPIKSPTGVESGGVLRSYESGVFPKALIRLNEVDRPSISWYKNWTSGWDRVLVVEDVVSAVKATGAASTVAILGTHLSPGAILEMTGLNPSHVVLCLDPDATKKALELHKKWSGMFKKMTVAVPPADLKDMDNIEVIKFVNRSFEE